MEKQGKTVEQNIDLSKSDNALDRITLDRLR